MLATLFPYGLSVSILFSTIGSCFHNCFNFNNWIWSVEPRFIRFVRLDIRNQKDHMSICHRQIFFPKSLLSISKTIKSNQNTKAMLISEHEHFLLHIGNSMVHVSILLCWCTSGMRSRKRFRFLVIWRPDSKTRFLKKMIFKPNVLENETVEYSSNFIHFSLIRKITNICTKKILWWFVYKKKLFLILTCVFSILQNGNLKQTHTHTPFHR